MKRTRKTAFLGLVLEALEGRRLLSTSYTITDLSQEVGIPSGYTKFYIVGVDQSGDVAGTAETGTGVLSDQAFFWSAASGFQRIGPTGTTASAIGPEGEVVGSRAYTDGSFTKGSAFEWGGPFEGNTYAEIGAGDAQAVSGVDRSNTFIVGGIDPTASPEQWSVPSQPALTKNFGLISGYRLATVTAVSNVEGGADTVGYDDNGLSGNDEAFISYTPLGFLPGEDWSEATGVNASSVVVGYSSEGGIAHTQAVEWTQVSPGTFAVKGLGYSGTGNFSVANGINDSGDIVGNANTTSGGAAEGFIDSNGTMIDLNSLTPVAPHTIASALSINDQGQIFGQEANGDYYLLTPHVSSNPTPPTATLQRHPYGYVGRNKRYMYFAVTYSGAAQLNGATITSLSVTGSHSFAGQANLSSTTAGANADQLVGIFVLKNPRGNWSSSTFAGLTVTMPPGGISDDDGVSSLAATLGTVTKLVFA